VTKVEPQSPAATAGFDRGDEILAIGPTSDTMVDVATMTQQQISDAFGPAQVGVVRAFRVQPRTAAPGNPVVRTVTKALITLDPVPITEVIPRTGTTPIGYVALETFITPAEQQLRQAFATFKAQNVHDVIVDLRYDGGGLVSIAQLLASLLAEQEAGQPMFTFEFNSKHQDQNETIDFSDEPQAVQSNRVAFITTDATASASELTINSLEPYVDVAIIGGQTFGKPVGQSGFDMPDCDTVLRLIAFQTVNADNEGGYFTGLPDSQFSGDFCAADDDLTHERGDAAEDSTGTALSWLNNGVCPSAKALAPKALFPRTERPTLLEDNRPGLF
jgi:C-terminal processing protease CtpA/Prc